jgi:hypothetical protein
MHQKLRRALLPGLGAVALLGGLSWFLFGRSPSRPPVPTAAQVKPVAHAKAKRPAQAPRHFAGDRVNPAFAARTFAKQAKQLAISSESASSPAVAQSGEAPKLSSKVLTELGRSGNRKHAFDDPGLRKRLQTLSSSNRRLSDSMAIQRAKSMEAAGRVPRLTRDDSIRSVQVDKKPR